MGEAEPDTVVWTTILCDVSVDHIRDVPSAEYETMGPASNPFCARALRPVVVTAGAVVPLQVRNANVEANPAEVSNAGK
jgi:hypothetical protein